VSNNSVVSTFARERTKLQFGGTRDKKGFLQLQGASADSNFPSTTSAPHDTTTVVYSELNE
jgi:hypothetical protein